ncbi:MAG: DUF3657 domain-containing protein [Actinobacteria bacterium]|nr:DUF3657 domain-containing protein [Actinomycetota bacterium]
MTLNRTKSLLDDIKKPILSPDLLHIQFNLLLANMTDDEETNENPKFNIVSTQTISLQQIGSGFHHYYPITFDSYNFVELDCMIHAAITNIFIIKYSLGNEKSWEIPNSINPNSALKKFEELKSDESANRESFFESSYFFEKSKSRVSTLIKSVSNLSEKAGNSGYSFLNLFPSESPKTSTPNNKKSLSQNVSSRSNLSVSRKSENLNLQEIEALYHLYSNILLKNYARIFQSSDFIMKEFELWRKETEKFSMEFDYQEASRTDEAENECVFLTHREEIHDILKSITTFPEFSRMFHKYLLVYNSQLSGRWSQLFISYRSVMKRIRIELQKEYEKEIKIFWRQQMMVHTRK